jgi:hypothetical protein
LRSSCSRGYLAGLMPLPGAGSTAKMEVAAAAKRLLIAEQGGPTTAAALVYKHGLSQALLCLGLQNIVQPIRNAGDAFQLRITLASVIVQLDDFVVAGVLDDQLDGGA